MAALKLPVYWVASSVWIIAGLLVGGIGGYAIAHQTSAATFQQVDPAAIPRQAFPGVKLNYVGSGTFRVPGQVAPGTYNLTSTGNTFGCKWARLKANNDDTKSVIDGGIVVRGGFDTVTVGAGDKFLRLRGDCTWTPAEVQ